MNGLSIKKTLTSKDKEAIIFGKFEYHHKRDNFEPNKWFRSLVALALVPPGKVEDCFEHLLDTHPDYPEIQKLCDYVTETWIEGKFPIELWNHYDNDGPRTNNHIEGYNLKLQKFATCAHPNIWLFIGTIKQEEATYGCNFYRLELGKYKQRGRNKVDMERDIAILLAKNKYISNTVSIFEFLSYLGHIMHDYSDKQKKIKKKLLKIN